MKTEARDWSEVATKNGMPADTVSWKRQRRVLPTNLQRKCSTSGSRAVRELISVVLSCRVCGNLSKQPPETDTDAYIEFWSR